MSKSVCVCVCPLTIDSVNLLHALRSPFSRLLIWMSSQCTLHSCAANSFSNFTFLNDRTCGWAGQSGTNAKERKSQRNRMGHSNTCAGMNGPGAFSEHWGIFIELIQTPCPSKGLQSNSIAKNTLRFSWRTLRFPEKHENHKAAVVFSEKASTPHRPEEIFCL